MLVRSSLLGATSSMSLSVSRMPGCCLASVALRLAWERRRLAELGVAQGVRKLSSEGEGVEGDDNVVDRLRLRRDVKPPEAAFVP